MLIPDRPRRIAPDSFGFTILLGLFAALPALSIDISAPTLQLLPEALHTNTMMAGLTLSLFMVGFALGQLAGGPLSDGRGRRPVLLAGLACYTVSSLLCAISTSGLSLVLARCVQGLGAGACCVLSFAIVQDFFEGDAARRKRSYVTVLLGAVPMAAPALGSALSGLVGWRAIYGVLTVAGLLLFFISLAGMPERERTAKPISAVAGPERPLPLWRDRPFIALTVTNALSYGAAFAYIAGAPVVVIGQLGFSSATFAGLFACTAAALTAGAWGSGLLSRQKLGARVLAGLSLGLAAAAAVVLQGSISSYGFQPRVIIPLLLVVMFARGLTAPNLQHLAIERRREQAGTASSAVGVSQLLSGALSSGAVAALLPSYGLAAISLPMTLLAVLALLVCQATRRLP